jgi:hypothetical protein
MVSQRHRIGGLCPPEFQHDQRGIAKLDVSAFEAKEYEEFKKEPESRSQEVRG